MDMFETKALIIEPKKEVYFKEISLSRKDISEVDISWNVSTVCNSERRRFKLTKSHNDTRKFVGGHEAVGFINEDGHLKKRYALLPHSNCLTRADDNKCHACSSGNENLCKKMTHAGLDSNTPSGFTKRMWVPWSQLFDVSECDDELAPFLEPLACVIRSWEKIKRKLSKKGTSVAIVGGGPIGCLHAMYAKRINKFNKIFISEINAERRETLSRIFYDFSNIAIIPKMRKLKCDISIMAASNSGAYTKALELTKQNGIVVLFSGFDKLDFKNSTFLPEIIHRNEFIHYADNHSFIGSSGYTSVDLKLSKKALIDFNDLKKLVTGRVFGLDSSIINNSDGTREDLESPVLIKDVHGHLNHHIKIQYFNNN